MDKPFEPPKTEAEFKERADKMTVGGAESLLNALRTRRAAAVKPFDLEITFLKKVLDHKKGQA